MSSLRSPYLPPGTPGLGVDVEELAEDCCAVRSQLEYLQRLLLQVRGEEQRNSDSEASPVRLQEVSVNHNEQNYYFIVKTTPKMCLRLNGQVCWSSLIIFEI